MIKAYTIASGKGGTGKMTATNLEQRYAAWAGNCIIDADMGMANIAGSRLIETPITLHEVLPKADPGRDS